MLQIPDEAIADGCHPRREERERKQEKKEYEKEERAAAPLSTQPLLKVNIELIKRSTCQSITPPAFPSPLSP